MRPSFVSSLLLLCLFLTKAQGIRLEKGSFAAQKHKQDQESNLLKKINSDDYKEAILCEDEKYCTGKIKNWKLVTSSTSSYHDISKNVKNGGTEAKPPEIGNKSNYKVNGEEREMLVNKNEEHSHEHYQDLVDMDYSPAKKKPPIHN